MAKEIFLSQSKMIVMETRNIKSYSLAEMEDKYVGKVGTKEREQYEYELRRRTILLAKGRKKKKASNRERPAT
jgi:hypothetical protein